MRSFLKLGLMVVTQVFVAQAYANIDVTCVSDDCLAQGWQAVDLMTGDSSDVACRNGDCNANGWGSMYKDRLVGEAFCKAGGCFTEGWFLHDTQSGQNVGEVSCFAVNDTSDCLQNGWRTFEYGHGFYDTNCVNGDCRNIGWDVTAPGYPVQPARCKDGGCFTKGWTVYQ